MKTIRMFLSAWLLGTVLAVTPAQAGGIGTDLTGLGLCLYMDCEARGSWAADPYGWPNPATMTVPTLPYVQRGAFVSTGYFNLDIGNVEADVESLTLTYAHDPFVFQLNAVHADVSGEAISAPGLKFDMNTDLVRFAAAVDLGRAGIVDGLSVGVLATLPVTDSDLDLSVGGFNVVDSVEDRDLDLTVGVHYRTGAKDWFAVGVSVQMIENDVRTTSVDPDTGMSFFDKGTTNAWFARVGVSLLPFVPLGLVETGSIAGELASEFRLGVDVEHRNISAPGEGTLAKEIVYVGVDARLLPDAWNPVSKYIRPYGIGGVDTDGGWGAGLGLYGNPEGPLAWFSLNAGYSSRDLAPSIGERVNQVGVGISLVVPF